MSDQCNGCSIKAENLHLRMYAPARRAEKNTEPVKQINPTDWAAWGMEPPDNEGWVPYVEVMDEQ